MIHKWIDTLAGPSLKPATMWLLERLLGIWLLCMSLYLLPIKDILWGADSFFAVAKGGSGFISNMFYVLSYNRWLDDAIFFTHLIAVLWLIAGRWTTVAKVVVYFTGYVLWYAAYYTYNSGYLTCLLLVFFLIFSFPRSKRAILGVTTNLAMLAIMLQVAHIYAVAASAKWAGEDWLNGSAVYYAINLDHYSADWMQEMIGEASWLLIAMNFFGLIYQTLFPLLIWFKKIKLPLLVCGMIFHLGIAVMLGLYDFGFAMIIAYVVFFDEKWTINILSKAPNVLIPKWIRNA